MSLINNHFSRILSFCHKIICDISIKWRPDNEVYLSYIVFHKTIRLVSLCCLINQTLSITRPFWQVPACETVYKHSHSQFWPLLAACFEPSSLHALQNKLDSPFPFQNRCFCFISCGPGVGVGFLLFFYMSHMCLAFLLMWRNLSKLGVVIQYFISPTNAQPICFNP